jgi:hypothetical protein
MRSSAFFFLMALAAASAAASFSMRSRRSLVVMMSIRIKIDRMGVGTGRCGSTRQVVTFQGL